MAKHQQMIRWPPEDEDPEIQRILDMTDEEVMKEHLAYYGGDQKLADKATDMLKARIIELINKVRPWRN